MLPDITYTEAQAVMNPGDTLVLYTDGATEACNIEGQDLGTEGLASILASLLAGNSDFPTMNQVEESILRYSGSLRLTDDLTLIAITRRH
jgi:sigma-B regulation protein RsbU (phosphoserine phosphatase)